MSARSVSFNFYNRCTMRIEGLCRRSLHDINDKFLYFRTGHIPDPDLLVSIGRFTPACDNAVIVENKYAVRPGCVSWKDRVKGLGFRAEIEGLDHAGTTVRFQADARIRLRFPWTLFPDLVLHLYVLQPLLEHKLAQRGIFLLHSAGVSKEGRSSLISGRGGTFKTNLTAGLMRRGFELLGDDMIALHNGKVLPFPTCINWFEFILNSSQDENLGPAGRFRLFMHLLSHRESNPVSIATSAVPKTLFLLCRDLDRSRTEITEISAPEVLISLDTNQQLESRAYVSHGYKIGQFLDAYKYIFPLCFAVEHHSKWLGEMRRLVKHADCHRVALPRKWNETEAINKILTNS